jgi:O-antigen/teichoic acid export membrane protein
MSDGAPRATGDRDRDSGRADLRRALRNMAAKAGSLVVERGAQLALLLAAPMLGVVSFGRFSYATGVTAVLAFGTDLGLTLWTTRALAREPALSERVMGTAFRLRLYAMPPYFVCLAAIAIALGPGEARAALLPIGVASLARVFLDHARAVFRAHERIADEGKVNALVASLATAGGLAALAITHRGLPALAIGMMVGTLAGTVYGFALLGRVYGRWTGKLDRALARRMLGESLPFLLAGLFALAYSRGDVVVVRALTNDATVGAYRAAGQLYEVAKNVPAVVMVAMFPQLARSFMLARARLRRAERSVSLALLAAGALAGLVLALAGGLVARRIFGPEFARTLPVLYVLSAALPLVFVNCGLTHFLVARDLGVLNLIFSGAMVLVNYGANLWFARRMGAPGAAWSMLITEAALFVCCAIALRGARRGDAAFIPRE